MTESSFYPNNFFDMDNFDPNVNVKSKKAHWRFVSCQNLAERKLNGVFGQLMLTFTCSGLDNANSCRSLLEHITLKLHSSLINQIKINQMQRYWIEARGPLFKDHKTKNSCLSLFFIFLILWKHSNWFKYLFLVGVDIIKDSR